MRSYLLCLRSDGNNCYQGKACSKKGGVHKRANAAISAAVTEALSKSGSRGSGRGGGKVYPIKFNNEDAVIKVVASKHTEAEVKKEVQNLVGVKQYLAWAEKETGGKKQYFIIMKYMGKTQEEWMAADKSLKAATFVKLREPTVARYKKEFGASNP